MKIDSLSSFSIRSYVTIGMLGASALMLVVAWSAYVDSSHIEPESELAPRAGEPAVNPQELRTLFPRVQVDESRYRGIAEKNLFSEDRKAWEAQGGEGDKSPVEAPEIKKGSDIKRGDVALFGTSIVGEAKSAVVRFNRFSGPRKSFVVHEGETVRDQDERSSATNAYTVVSIERGKVVIKDAAGAVFEIGLRDHERPKPLPVEEPSAMPPIAPPQQQGPSPAQPQGQTQPPWQKPSGAQPPAQQGLYKLPRSLPSPATVPGQPATPPPEPAPQDDAAAGARDGGASPDMPPVPTNE